jgi:hypothetical protein
VDLKSMGFHDGSENCTVCEHFDSQSGECMKATAGDKSVGPTPEAAWCHGFESEGGDEANSGNPEEGEENAEGNGAPPARGMR